jgi:hypothetical protein
VGFYSNFRGKSVPLGIADFVYIVHTKSMGKMFEQSARLVAKL